MLEITADDIAQLADDDLRELVGRLCEAEMRKRQLPAKAVTWGGHQDAADGGIDVRVDLVEGTAIDGFIPRAVTGFQVKKPDTAEGAISDEMRPKGTLRPAIQDLARRNGAYIIVSSGASVTDTRLHSRKAAMASAVADAPNGTALELDYYDRTRVATWVHDHPGLIPWVRKQAGRPIAGWQSYGAWAHPAEDVDAEYLPDDAARMRTGKREDGAGLTAVDGIERIRGALRQPGSAVRLVGLSGVGKTRLVQALFDERIGRDSLTPALALYTNESDAPDPTPFAMVSNVAGAGTPMVVVVDNCPTGLHRRLMQLCKAPGCAVSVITVEYDIREDRPEETQVFEMEPASLGMTEKLVQMRFPAISQVDVRTIAGFAGGNARIAIALAGTIGGGESISGLTDDELFQRLFRQRHDHDPALLRAAEACSLVYSFDGEDTGDGSELERLGQLVGLDSRSLYARVAELQRRNLAQSRSVWWAVLPHAIANRLAALALQNIPLPMIETQLGSMAPERIKKSFSRRLGYLHEKPNARRIVQKWLAPGGMLSDLSVLDELHVEIMRNIAPVAPEEVLNAFENAVTGPKLHAILKKRRNFVQLLRSLAFDSALFERCTELLVIFATEDTPADNVGVTESVASLFFAYLSGTHATVEQRIAFMERLVRSGDEKRQALGIEALQALLQAGHFTSSHDFQFGSHSRDYGYSPTAPQLRDWYEAVLKSAEVLAISDLPTAKGVQNAIAGSIRDIWTRAYGAVERVSRTIAAKGYWREGWIAVRQTLNYDASGMGEAAKTRLIALETDLRPKYLAQKVRSVVLSHATGNIDLNDYEEEETSLSSGWQRTEDLAMKLGEEVAVDELTLTELLPEIVSGSGKLVSFGKGLALGASDVRAVWTLLVTAFTATVEERRAVQVLIGFLGGLGERDQCVASQLLDEAVDHVVLGCQFPMLQCAVAIDKDGVNRLRRSLTLGLASASVFQCLAHGRFHETVSAEDRAGLILQIIEQPKGGHAGLEIVFYRLFGDNQNKSAHEPEIIQAGQRMLIRLEIANAYARQDHELDLVTAACLIGTSAAPIAKVICQRFKEAADTRHLHAYNFRRFLGAICKVQPLVFLDAFFGGDAAQRCASARMFERIGERDANPLDNIATEQLIAWCDGDSGTRYIAMATVVSYLRGPEDEASSQWSAIALDLLRFAPDPVAIARQFSERFSPSGWSGSLASILEGRQGLLTELLQNDDPRMVAFAKDEGKRLASQIQQERRLETAQDRLTDERFE